MAEGGVVFEGGPQFEHDMARLSKQIEDADIQALTDVARMLVPSVQSIMPKLTGRLAGSVTAGAEGQDAFVSASTPYAGWIEFGGSRGRERIALGRFLFPTVRESGSTVQNRLSTATANKIGGFSWSHTS